MDSRRAEWERKALEVVEILLADCVDEATLLDCAKRINQNYYSDVIEERFIIKRCGYPVCDKVLTQLPKQKYHISASRNRVYDLTERKKFCSNWCFRASNYFASQLSTEPVWAIDATKYNVELLTETKEAEKTQRETITATERAVAKDRTHLSDTQAEKEDSDFATVQSILTSWYEPRPRLSEEDNADACKGLAVSDVESEEDQKVLDKLKRFGINPQTGQFQSDSSNRRPYDVVERRTNDSPIALPHLDSAAQDSSRRQIVLGHLSAAYKSFSVQDPDYLKKCVQKLRLDRSNIAMKPNQWKLAALIVFLSSTENPSSTILDEAMEKVLSNSHAQRDEVNRLALVVSRKQGIQ
ncbi:putative RNA polymerase II subunit B1 CTD phosphatase RPAP2 isoform X2 [Oscarella lobularis]|uniref:putative RNA polymerase II subunit B1 CTD phosphatase RPAP2 isoform X2 n=1 Tax=Oscarella lobularis TaxID=121494 RepID=UPI0033134F63